MIKTLRQLAYLLLPVVAFVLVFRAGLGSWFQQDDFAHLKIAASTSFSELPALLIRPIAQGTFRPLSERLYYWLLFHAFGLDAFPARVFCFLVQSANCVLLSLLLFRLTGSRAAAALAALAWAVHPSLTIPLTWVATTNQVLWALCVLGAVYLFDRFCASNRRGYLAGAWACYLLGFGVLESNVATPALLTLFALTMERRRVAAALVFWPPAIAFAAAHFLWIPKASKGVYGVNFDAGMFSAAWTYWSWLWYLEPSAGILGLPGWVGTVTAGAATTGAALLITRSQSRPMALFGLGWFLAALGPVLPLHGHLTDYYLTVPAIGIAFLFASAWGLYPRAAAALLGVYLLLHVPVSNNYSAFNAGRSLEMQALVLGVEQAQKMYPGKILLLDGVQDELFWSGIYDTPFSLVGAPDTLLTPGSAANLFPNAELPHVEDYTLAPQAALALLRSGRAEVFTVKNRRLARETGIYGARLGQTSRTEMPQWINMSGPGYESFIGPGWHGREEGFRWMSKTAAVDLEGAGGFVEVRGDCREEQLRTAGRITVRASWNGRLLGEQILTACPPNMSLRFPLPGDREAKGRLTLEASPTIRVGADRRDLGLAVRSVEIR